MVIFDNPNKNARVMEAYDLADTITHFLGKGAATRRCTSHDSNSKLYSERSTPSSTASSAT